MNRAHIELLEERYIEAVNGYVIAYVNKHHVSPIGWANGRVGEVLILENGKRVDFRDIKADIERGKVLTDTKASQTDEVSFVNAEKCCGNCKDGCIQSDGNYVRCSRDGTYHKRNDAPCNRDEKGGNE